MKQSRLKISDNPSLKCRLASELAAATLGYSLLMALIAVTCIPATQALSHAVRSSTCAVLGKGFYLNPSASYDQTSGHCQTGTSGLNSGPPPPPYF